MQTATYKEYPLSAIGISEHNVRATATSAEANHQLLASIEAHGLIENLVGHSGTDPDGNDTFYVIAGGRRLNALCQLAKAGKIPADQPIPCMEVAEGDSLAEISLAENTIREQMHPADQIVAFTALLHEGVTTRDIADRFGVNVRTVEQRIRLGQVAPELIKRYREGDFDLEALQAFTLDPDHDTQIRVWEIISGQSDGQVPGWAVRELINETRVSGTHRFARFVGPNAYRDAGGVMETDLFDEREDSSQWYNDPSLLRELALKKLATFVQNEPRLQGWKWVQPQLEFDYTERRAFGSIEPNLPELTVLQQTEVDQCNAKITQYREADIAKLDEETKQTLADQYREANGRIHQIENEQRQNRYHTELEKSVSGCVVHIDYDGSPNIVSGLVKPDEIKEAKKVLGLDQKTEDGDAVPTGGKPFSGPATRAPDARTQANKSAGLSGALAEQLAAARNRILKTALLGHFKTAFDLFVFQAAKAAFSQYNAGARTLSITLTQTSDDCNHRPGQPDILPNSLNDPFEDTADLPLDWLNKDTDEAQYIAFVQLTTSQKELLFNAVVANTLIPQLNYEKVTGHPEYEYTVARCEIDFNKALRPGGVNYFKRLTSASIDTIARTLFTAESAKLVCGMKKPEKVATMEAVFAIEDNPDHLDAESRQAAREWTIPGLTAHRDTNLATQARAAVDNQETATASTAAEEPSLTDTETTEAASATTEPDPQPAADDQPRDASPDSATDATGAASNPSDTESADANAKAPKAKSAGSGFTAITLDHKDIAKMLKPKTNGATPPAAMPPTQSSQKPLPAFLTDS